jgi:glyoxylase-like metal-dependent hydrolase (beta-lactamase superfamily II)
MCVTPEKPRRTERGVNAGVPRSWQSLHHAHRQLGRSASDIAAVVLTHAHFDHLGFAERARTTFDVPV